MDTRVDTADEMVDSLLLSIQAYLSNAEEAHTTPRIAHPQRRNVTNQPEQRVKRYHRKRVGTDRAR